MLLPMVSFIPMPTQTEHPIIFIRGGKSISVGPAWRGRSVEVVCHIRSHVKNITFGPRSEIKTKNPESDPLLQHWIFIWRTIVIRN